MCEILGTWKENKEVDEGAEGGEKGLRRKSGKQDKERSREMGRNEREGGPERMSKGREEAQRGKA